MKLLVINIENQLSFNQYISNNCKFALNRVSVMRYVIWYYLFNLKNVKNAHAGACKFTKSNTPPWVFSRFLNCTNGTKSRKTLQIIWEN